MDYTNDFGVTYKGISLFSYSFIDDFLSTTTQGEDDSYIPNSLKPFFSLNATRCEKPQGLRKFRELRYILNETDFISIPLPIFPSSPDFIVILREARDTGLGRIVTSPENINNFWSPKFACRQ